MTERWEYMSVVWDNTIKQTSQNPVEFEQESGYYIWRPGATKAEHHPSWSSKDKSVSGPSELEILNELGAEGWELVSRDTVNSIVGKLASGWLEGGRPVRTRATLKRRIED